MDQEHVDEPARLLPEGMNVIYTGERFIPYEPSKCDSKLLRQNLMRFSDKRLDGVRALKPMVEHLAEHVMLSPRHFLNRYFSFRAIEELESVLETGELERLYEKDEPSSETPVPGALTTREAVQTEIDALRDRFGVSQPIRVHFVEKLEDIPGADGTDAATSFQGLPFLPNPYLVELVLANEFLSYPSRYREYLLLHEFAHCLQVLDAWPYYDGEEEHHNESYARACAKIGFEPIDASYYPLGSYRVVCQKCGDIKYFKEGQTMRSCGMSMEAFARTYVCGICQGPIRAEHIEVPVLTMGDEVFEVGLDGESCKLIGMLQLW